MPDDPHVHPQRGWRMWLTKRRWYDRTHRLRNRWRINRHAAHGGFYVRHPIEGEVLEALDEGRLTIGEGALLEPGCWLTLAPEARIEIGAGCFLNRNTMLAAQGSIEIGDHTMLANGCFVGDAEHRYDDPEVPVTWQGFNPKGPVEIGENCWFGVNCAVAGGVAIDAPAAQAAVVALVPAALRPPQPPTTQLGHVSSFPERRRVGSAPDLVQEEGSDGNVRNERRAGGRVGPEVP